MSTTKRRTIGLIVVIVILFLILFVPDPVSVDTRNDPDSKLAAVGHALQTLLSNGRVLTEDGYVRLLDQDITGSGKQVLVLNEIGISDDVFRRYGCKKYRETEMRDSDTLLAFYIEKDAEGNDAKNISVAAFSLDFNRAWEIRVFRSLATRYYVYRFIKR